MHPTSKKGSKSFRTTYSVPVASSTNPWPPVAGPERRRSRSKPAETLACLLKLLMKKLMRHPLRRR